MLASVSPALGQDRYQRLEQMHHTAWTARDGLIGRPNHLAQTSDGYLWIGTSNGLYRFDGVEFERYQPPGAFPAVGVETLLAVKDGGLWVGYTRGGATFIAPDGRITNYSIQDGLPVGVIRSFAEDDQGAVWVAATGGLARLEGGRWQDVRKDWDYPCRSAWRLFVDGEGTLWVGGASPDRMLYLPKGTRTFKDLGVNRSASAFAQLGDGRIAIADFHAPIVHEVRRGADGSAVRRTLVELTAYGLEFDGDGGLWIGGLGITRLRIDDESQWTVSSREGPPAEDFTLDDGLSGRLGDSVLVDREGNVWVATESGLDRFRRRNVTWKPDPRVVRSASLLTDSQGEVWVLSSDQPWLWRARDGTSVPNAPGSLASGYPDSDGSAWLTTSDNRLFHWVGERFIQVPPPDEVIARGYLFSVLAATKDRSGRLWASMNGIGQFYRQDERWTFVPVLLDRLDWTATKAHADAADRVWLAYRDEMAMVHHGKIRLFTKADGLDLGPLLALASRDVEFWVAGEQGLAFLKGDRFHVVRPALGSEFGAITDIVTARDGLWLSAAIGIVHIPDAEVRRFTGDSTYRVRYDLFDVVSDLPEALRPRGLAATAAQSRDGVVWFLASGGVVSVDPQQIVRNTVPPPVLVRSVTADDKAYSPRGDVSLPPLTRTIRIDYTALSLTIPERVRFRYCLEGWETDWHDAGTRRTVFYTDLRPGRYTFRVLAANNDGVWNETGAMLPFTVAPAWYQTVWFQGLVAAGVLGAVAILIRVRVRRVSAALSARFDERLAERTRIARELHDTLLQTVQGSKMVADDALDRPRDAVHLHRAMERLSTWLGQAVSEGRAALNSLRASTVTTNDLAESLQHAADDPTRPQTMAVKVAVRGELRDLHPIVRDEICRIGYAAIHNAYAHSQATELEIALEYAHDLRLRVSDNGVGMDPAIADRGKQGRFGLAGMRERAANIGARFTIDSSPSGTRVVLVVPGHTAFRRSPATPSH